VQKTIPSEQYYTLIHYATLAANGHNTQPWHFAVKGNSIEINPDFTRCLPIVDPQHRELWMSLGCALENLLISARSLGFSTQVTYPSKAEYIQVELIEDTPRNDVLFNSIPKRQTTRSAFDGQPVNGSDLDQLQTLPLEPGVALHFMTNPVDMEKAVEFINQGNLTQYGNKAFVKELIHWLRFNRREYLSTRDGLYSVCSGNPEVPRWLGTMFVSGTNPKKQADADAKKLRSSSGAVIITSDRDDNTSWVRVGQVTERLALMMTSRNIKSAFLNQPIEVPSLRGQFQSAMGLGSSLPQLLVRFGYTNAMPSSLRRPLEQVLI